VVQRGDDLLSAAREHTFHAAAAGFAVGYAFVAFVSALLNILVTGVDETPGRRTFVLTSLAVLVVVATAALVALPSARGGRRSP
jgi:MFS-type transporter involved in bile tolerance (Atg22 family)